MGRQESDWHSSSNPTSTPRVPWLLLLGAWPLVLACVAGCSTFDRAPGELLSTNALPKSNMRMASASLEGQENESDATHQPRRRPCLRAIHDAFTRPWYGNYLGPGDLGADKQPIDALDAAAREHDLAYDKCNAAGIIGALTNLESGRADLLLAKRAFRALPSLDFGGKLMGVATGVTMGCLGVIKIPIADARDAIRHKSATEVASPTS